MLKITGNEWIFSLSVFMVILLSFVPFTLQILALSPQFVRQLVTDPENDYIEVINKRSQPLFENKPWCSEGNRQIADISAVSYSSDGQTLFATIWLTNPFQSMEEEQVYKQNENKNNKILEQKIIKIYDYTDRYQNLSATEKMQEIQERYKQLDSDPSVDVNIFRIEQNQLNKINILQIEYREENKFNFLAFIIMNNKIYGIKFQSLKPDYYEYLPLIHKVVNSFEFKNYKNDQFVTYENPYAKIKFQYPANWHKMSENDYDISFELNSSHVYKPLFEIRSSQINNVNEYKNFTIDAFKQQVMKEWGSYWNYNDHIVTDMDTKFVNLTKNNYIYAVQVDFQNDMNTTDKYKGIKVYAFINGNSYLISFNGLESDYYEYLPLIHKVVNSFEFKNYKNDQFVTYENPYAKIKFQYPANWHIDSHSTNLPRFTFPEDVSFLEDELSVLEKDRNKEDINSLSYGMYIDVASTFDSGADYVIEVNRDPGQYNWSKLVKELSPENKQKTNEESNFTKFIDKNNKDHISFSVDLEKINSPKYFSIMFYAVEYGDNNCAFIDVTNFLPIPLPDVEMKVEPNKPITITRGKEAIVELHIKSDSSINSHVLVSSSKNEENKDIKTNILPNSTLIPPKDTIISLLKIKPLDTALARSYTVPIIAKLSLPETYLIQFGGEEINFTNPSPINITKKSNITVIVENPPSTSEIIKNWLNDYFNPLTGAWTTITTIGTGILGWKIWKGKKKKED